MIDFIKTYVRFVILHRWNKIPKENLEILEHNWKNKPTSGLKYWVYNKVKKLNKYN